MWPWVIGGVVLLLAFAGQFNQGQPNAGPCTLEAVAAAAPDVVARATKGDETPRVIAVRNRGSSAWRDVELTIRGLGTRGPTQGQPTGPHSYRVLGIDSGELFAKNIDEFKKPDGTPWVPMMMRPTEVTVRASTNGACVHSNSSSTSKFGTGKILCSTT